MNNEACLKNLIIPKAIKKGDTIALISISGGRAGDDDMIQRYNIGKERLENIWGVKVVPTPNALKGSQYLYEHPEARGDDLMWALKNPDIKGIICIMGGDDSYRVFPHIDINVIKENPKVFMGYSDIASWMTVFANAGVRAYYGPNLLTPIAQPVQLDEYTKNAITKTIFSTEIIGEIFPAPKTTNIQWQNVEAKDIEWTENTGYKILQGSGTVKGRIFGGTIGPLRQIMGTDFFPRKEFFNGCIIALEGPPNNLLLYLHDLRALDAAGVFTNAAGILTSKLSEEEEKLWLKFLKYEAKREDIPVLTNLDFIHRTPMTVLPMGAIAEIDCEKATFKILESGVTK